MQKRLPGKLRGESTWEIGNRTEKLCGMEGCAGKKNVKDFGAVV